MGTHTHPTHTPHSTYSHFTHNVTLSQQQLLMKREHTFCHQKQQQQNKYGHFEMTTSQTPKNRCVFSTTNQHQKQRWFSCVTHTHIHIHCLVFNNNVTQSSFVSILGVCGGWGNQPTQPNPTKHTTHNNTQHNSNNFDHNNKK